MKKLSEQKKKIKAKKSDILKKIVIQQELLDTLKTMASPDTAVKRYYRDVLVSSQLKQKIPVTRGLAANQMSHLFNEHSNKLKVLKKELEHLDHQLNDINERITVQLSLIDQNQPLPMPSHQEHNAVEEFENTLASQYQPEPSTFGVETCVSEQDFRPAPSDLTIMAASFEQQDILKTNYAIEFSFLLIMSFLLAKLFLKKDEIHKEHEHSPPLISSTNNSYGFFNRSSQADFEGPHLSMSVAVAIGKKMQDAEESDMREDLVLKS